MLRAIRESLRDAAEVFAARNLPWHLLAIALTFACVASGLDGWVAAASRESGVRAIARFAGRVGMWTPIVAPLVLLAIGRLRGNDRLARSGWRLAEAEVLALAVCAAYKALTGRPGPSQDFAGTLAEASRVFRFGFLRGGVYWGWPSSHVMVAVAGAVALSLLHAERRAVRLLPLVYAAYMALSVSVSFHWFSDGVAAVVLGGVIGRVVGRAGSHADASVTPIR